MVVEVTKKTEAKERIPYGIDAYIFYQKPKKVIFLSTEEDLEKVCNTLLTNKINFYIRGAGTGYAGAAVPINKKETALKLLGFDKILCIDPENRRIEVEVGVTPFSINKYAEVYNLLYPPDPASFKVCTIGGNIATNAGGPHCYLYGVTSNYVEKIRCYIPRFRKIFDIGGSPYSLDYDIKNLFIGSGGALGIFTKVKLKLTLKPPQIYTYLIYFNDYRKAIKFIHEVLLKGLVLAALDMSCEPYIPDKQTKIGAHLLISIHGGSEYVKYCKNVLNELIKKYATDSLESVGEELMNVRAKLVRENVRKVIKLTRKPQYLLFDAVVPRAYLGGMLDYLYFLSEKLKMPLMNTFHAGDGNIHPTFFFDPQSPKDLQKLKIFWYAVLKRVLKFGGSISGEHGIGFEKRDLFTYYLDDAILDIHQAIKSFFDPLLLMGRDRIFINKKSKQLIKKRVKELDGLLAKLSLDSYKTSYEYKNNSKEGILNGVIKVNGGESVPRINNRLKKMGYMLPYFPIIFHDESISFLIRYNIPNIYDHLFELRNIIVGTSFSKGNLLIGGKVLKNVAGFSLNFLSTYLEYGKPTSFFLRIYPFRNLQYITISFSTSLNSLDQIIDEITKRSVNTIIYKLGKKYNVEIVVYNDTLEILNIQKILDAKNIRYDLKWEVDPPAFNSREFLIVGLNSKVKITTLQKIGEYGYLILSRCLVVPVNKRNYRITTRKIIEILAQNVESIRYINKKGGRYLYLKEELASQIKITKNFIFYLKKFLSNPRYTTLSKSEKPIDLPPIKPQAISPLLSKSIENEVKKCTRCGLCLSVCPLYREKKDEVYSPRGLLVLLKEYGTKNNKLTNDILSFCLKHCKKNPLCEDVCTTGVSFSTIFREYKKEEGKNG
jgi:glycolate oxidase